MGRAFTDQDVGPPDGAYVRQRWIRRGRIEFLKKCDQILMNNGAVVGRARYPTRDAARGHVRRLKQDMVDLRMHEDWQLKPRTERVGGGWVWALEYLGRE